MFRRDPSRAWVAPTGPAKGHCPVLGPTGCGKTELTKQIAKFIFGQELLYRFDMSEFLHLDQVKLFVGDETGQIGRLGTVLAEHNKESSSSMKSKRHTISFGTSSCR